MFLLRPKTTSSKPLKNLTFSLWGSSSIMERIKLKKMIAKSLSSVFNKLERSVISLKEYAGV